MDFLDLVLFLFYTLLGLIPVYLGYGIYKKNRDKTSFYFNIMALCQTIFFIMNVSGRNLIDTIFISQNSLESTRIIVALIVNFIAFPVISISMYFFFLFLRSITGDTISGYFRNLFILFQIGVLLQFIIFIMENVSDAPENWTVINDNPGVIVANLLLMLFITYEIVSFIIRLYRSDKVENRKLLFLGYYYLLVYIFIFLFFMVLQHYIKMNIAVFFIYVFSINIPPAIYLKFRCRTQKQDENPAADKSADPMKVGDFTSRELDIVKLISQGKSNREIGDELYISTQTVKNIITVIYRKAGVKSRTELMSRIMKSAQ